MAVQDLKNNWQGKTTEKLHSHIKSHYPKYFIATSSGNDLELAFFTIGYEGLSLESYLNKLLDSNVRLLCDIRKNAFSQKYGFSKSELSDALGKVGISYQHIPSLGIVSEKRQQLNTDQDYKQLFDEYEQETLINQQASLDKLVELLHQYKRIAITCFEADVYHCHRSRVAKSLSNQEGFPCKIRHL